MKLLKFVTNQKMLQVASIVTAISCLSLIATVETTDAALTSSQPVTVTVVADAWIVSSLTVTPNDYKTVTVTWSAIAEYPNYTLQWSTNSDFSSASTATVTGSSYKISSLSENTKYYYRIQSIGAPTNGWSAVASVSTPYGPSIKTVSDLVAFDPAGQLWNYGVAGINTASRQSIGASGQSVPNDFFVTDWNGDGIQDLVLKNTNDQLELRVGLPNGGFTSQIIGQFGWNDYDITIGKWRKTDALPSIIAIQKSTGDLYLYENPTGGAHGNRIKFDTGWTGLVINLIDYDMDGNIDIIAKFPDGGLRLYRTDGNGAFIAEARPVINVNWNTMDSIHRSTDAEGPGTRGIVAREVATNDLYYYPIGTSSWGTKRKFGSGWGGYRIAGN